MADTRHRSQDSSSRGEHRASDHPFTDPVLVLHICASQKRKGHALLRCACRVVASAVNQNCEEVGNLSNRVP